MTLCQHYPARLVCRLLDFPRCQLYRHASPPADEESQLRAVLIRLAGGVAHLWLPPPDQDAATGGTPRQL